MNQVSLLLGWVLYTSIFAACCATGLVMASEKLYLGRSPGGWTPLHALVFGATLIIYNIHYIIRRPNPEISDRSAWTQHHRFWHWLVLGTGGLLCLVSLPRLSPAVLGLCLVLALLSLAYSLPLLPLSSGKRIREHGVIKIGVLTLVWTLVTAILPLIYWEISPLRFPLEIAIRFCFMFTLCLAFDLRDMQTDQEAGIQTIPNTLGERRSYRLMDGGLILFLMLSIAQYIHYPNISRLFAETLTALITKAVLVYTRKHPSDRLYLGAVDGMMLLYALLMLSIDLPY